MITLLLIWLVVSCVLMLLGMGTRHHSAGLPLAYFLSLSFIHVPGAMVHLEFEEWESVGVWTMIGFEQTAIGMVAFLIAVLISRYTAFTFHQNRPPIAKATIDLVALDRLALLYFFSGLVSFVATDFLGNIPSVSAIIASLKSLMVVGACLRLWVARESGNRVKWWQTIILVPLLPLFTLIKDGFVASGASLLLTIASFLISQSKGNRLSYCVFLPVFAFVGLSFFVNYMAARDDLRQLIWYQQVGIGDRIQRVVGMFESFQWLDLSNMQHRSLIDTRLNQNPLVGLAVTRLESKEVEYASGDTIGEVIVGLIPRALWPDKPAVGGGGTIVQHFTGVEFAQGTSIGAGQVLEFYVNFGTWGVIGGFFLFGWLLARIDLRIMGCLNGGDQNGFLFWSMIGFALINPGGNLLEIMVTTASSAIAALGLERILQKRFLGNTAATGLTTAKM